MNNIALNIRKIREQKGFSQEYVAQELDISQASYARLESEETKITVDRLFRLAEIFQIEVTEFFNEGRLNIQTQNNYEGAYGNGYVQNLTIANNEMIDKLMESYQVRLQEKDQQIEFLKSLLTNKK